MDNFPIQLSQNILAQAQLEQDTALLRRELYYLKEQKLENFLATDELKRIFWCNIYNAFVLIISKENNDGKDAFNHKRIKVARTALSLNDIEFRILKVKHKNPVFRFLYLLSISTFIKKMALKEIDSTIQSELDQTALNRSSSAS